jgi:putative membrane protein
MLLKEGVPFKYVFGKIKYEIILVALYTAVVTLVHERYIDFSIPISVPMILGTVISLLLGFRSNQAYERWWEARIVWGAIVNDSRTFSRQVLTYITNQIDTDEIKHFQDRIIKRQMAWNYALGQSLRGHDPMQGLEKYISKRELEYLSHYTNVPAGILELHSKDVMWATNQGWLNEFQQVAIDETITKFCDSMGRCERIKNTVFPSTYSSYIHMAMNFFIIMLPFCLISVFGYLTIPVVIAIAASFMLIEKMAIHLQDPFENKPTDTPMTTIARNIERDLRQMLKDTHTPERIEHEDAPVNQESFYIL